MDELTPEEIEELRAIFEEAKRYCCTRCFSLATQPKGLECGHIACALCISDGLSPNGEIECQSCRHCTKLGPLGILDLRDDKQSAECVRRIRESRDPFLLQALEAYRDHMVSGGSLSPSQYASSNDPGASLSPLKSPSRHASGDNGSEAASSSACRPVSFSSAPSFDAEQSGTADNLLDTIDDIISDFQEISGASSKAPTSTSSSSAASSASTSTTSSSSAGGGGGWMASLKGWWKGEKKLSKEEIFSMGESFAPFEVFEPEQRFKKHLKGLWFAPTDFAKSVEFDKCIPAYIPYYWVDIETTTTSSGNMGEGILAREESETHREERNMLLLAMEGAAGFHHIVAKFEDFDASRASMSRSQLSDGHFIQRAATWDAVFEVAGSMLRQIEVKEARQRLAKKAKKEKVPLSDFSALVTFSKSSRTCVYVPAWFGRYRFEGNSYSIVLNAQTGSIECDRPFGSGALGKLGKWTTSAIDNVLFSKEK